MRLHLRHITLIAILAAILIYTYILPYFSPYKDPMRWNQAPIDIPPLSRGYIFGTTTLGQDLFWVCSFGLRNSINFSALVGLISATIALFIGVISGYVRGKLSTVLSIIIDAFCVTPALPILILISAIWAGGAFMTNFAFLLSIFGWSWPARTIRSVILSLRERMFMNTARFSGYTVLDIIVYECLPYVFALFLMSLLNAMLWAIGMETTLATFGLTSLGIPSIGTIIFWAMSYQALVRGIWWWIVFPVVLLVVLIVTIYFILREIYVKML